MLKHDLMALTSTHRPAVNRSMRRGHSPKETAAEDRLARVATTVEPAVYVGDDGMSVMSPSGPVDSEHPPSGRATISATTIERVMPFSRGIDSTWVLANT